MDSLCRVRKNICSVVTDCLCAHPSGILVFIPSIINTKMTHSIAYKQFATRIYRLFYMFFPHHFISKNHVRGIWLVAIRQNVISFCVTVCLVKRTYLVKPQKIISMKAILKSVRNYILIYKIMCWNIKNVAIIKILLMLSCARQLLPSYTMTNQTIQRWYVGTFHCNKNIVKPIAHTIVQWTNPKDFIILCQNSLQRIDKDRKAINEEQVN